MTKKTRTILFFTFAALFVLAAPTVLFYSQGYRFDFETKKVVQTGGLYFKVAPRSAQVYLNGKLKGTTSLFTNSALVENLLPKTYYAEIKKDGYRSWQKTLEVKESQVTEAKNILLFPENINFAKLDLTPKQISDTVSVLPANATSSDGDKVIEANDHEIWVSFPKEKKKIFLSRFSEKICQVLWLNDYYIIFTVGDKIRTSSPDGSENLDFSPCSKLKAAEIDDRDRLNVIDLAEFNEPQIFWDKANSKLYILSQSSLFASDKLLP